MGSQLRQQLQPLRLRLGKKRAHTCDVATRTMQVGDEAGPDWVAASREYDRYGRGPRLGRKGRCVSTHCNDDGDLLAGEIGGKPRQPIVLTLSPTIVERDVLTLDKARFIESLPDERNQRRVDSRRTTAEQSDHWQCTLLRTRRERPRGRAADERDERAALHSITSSARSRIDVGSSIPIALAVLRLMAISNFVACSTGKSPAFAPLRILAT